MTLTIVIAAVLSLLLAAANGANDVSKGVATLVGAGTTDYRRALAWGTMWTTVGALAGALWGAAMIATFAKVWSADATAQAACAVIAGAGAWVLIATWTRLPVSTTHALMGALIGVGVAAFGVAGVRWEVLLWKVALPLAGTPLVGFAAGGLLTGIGRMARRRRAAPVPSCVCVSIAPSVVVEPALIPLPVVPMHTSAAAVRTTMPPALAVTTGSVADCDVHAPAAGVRLDVHHLHWGTAAAVSFARGLNDGPKLAFLMLAVPAVAGSAALGAGGSWWLAFGIVAAGMAIGSWFAGRRVTEKLAEGVADLDHGGGFGANLAAAGLVGAGAIWGLPMSTTHVATGAIVGSGLAGGGRAGVRWNTVRHLLAAWVITLPGAAALGLLAYALTAWIL